MSTGENFFWQARERMGVTQRVIADHLRMTCAAVSKWEAGTVPDIRLVPKLAAIYGVSEERLLWEMLKMARVGNEPADAPQPAAACA